jgi:hypothetical protein
MPDPAPRTGERSDERDFLAAEIALIFKVTMAYGNQ